MERTNDPNLQELCVVPGCGALTTYRAVIGDTLLVPACAHHSDQEIEAAAAERQG